MTNETCTGCNGRGEVGGLLPNGGGYDSEQCPFCKGSGATPTASGDMVSVPREPTRVACDDCKGSGEGTAMEGHGPDGYYEVTIVCPKCNGYGEVDAPAVQAQPVAGDSIERVIDAFESKERGVVQAHIAAQLVAELRAALAEAAAPQQAQAQAVALRMALNAMQENWRTVESDAAILAVAAALARPASTQQVSMDEALTDEQILSCLDGRQPVRLHHGAAVFEYRLFPLVDFARRVLALRQRLRIGGAG